MPDTLILNREFFDALAARNGVPSISEAARRGGIPVPTANNALNGKTSPDGRVVLGLLKGYGLTGDQISDLRLGEVFYMEPAPLS